ncbi:MAG TPA: ATP-grasp domain-containing protein [Haliangium sp.]|nr:ATP-grasp domain-containing protein [Haliangium sp.]
MPTRAPHTPPLPDPAGPAVLLLTSKRAYHTDDFVAAAARLGVPCVLGTDRCHVLAELWPQGAHALDFRDPDAAATTIAELHAARPLAGIVPTDEHTAIIAARAAARIGLPYNPVEAAELAGNKHRLRQRLRSAGLPQPRFAAVPADAGPDVVDAALAAAGLGFPVVIKPLHLSASRGVMRADDRAGLDRCLDRLRALLRDPEVTAMDPEAARSILIEGFVPGVEVAYEGLLTASDLRTLAIFDKPDPLDGPFFAETIYVTPSVQPAAVQDAIVRAVTDAARAMGLREGPVHAELRLAPHGWPRMDGAVRPAPPVAVVLELAARTIGGLCHRTLRFGAGIALDELVIAHAAGRDIDLPARRAGAASGVYMLPVPRPGVLRAVRGVEDASAVAGVQDVVITARPGDVLVPLPEGRSYVGFLFAGGPEPAQVTAALRRAVACIELDIATLL